MNISALSIRNPLPVVMLFVLVALAGLLAFRATAVQDFPDVELPIVTVTATLDGAAPAQLETEVARKLEDSIATVQGLTTLLGLLVVPAVFTYVDDARAWIARLARRPAAAAAAA